MYSKCLIFFFHIQKFFYLDSITFLVFTPQSGFRELPSCPTILSRRPCNEGYGTYTKQNSLTRCRYNLQNFVYVHRRRRLEDVDEAAHGRRRSTALVRRVSRHEPTARLVPRDAEFYKVHFVLLVIETEKRCKTEAEATSDVVQVAVRRRYHRPAPPPN